MTHEITEPFSGFPDFRANVTFVPIQFFTVVVPHCMRGTVRIVGYALRRILGWVDQNGNPTREQLRFTYRELIENAGVSRESIPDALREAIDRHFLRCVQPPNPDKAGQQAQSGIYELCWDEAGRYTDDPAKFCGFYYPEAAVVDVHNGTGTQRPKSARKNIPNAFFDYLLPRERLSVIRVVAALLFYSVQWGPGGERKVPVKKSVTELSRLTKLSRQHVHAAVSEACRRGYIALSDAGLFDPQAGKKSRAATYAIRWVHSDAVQAVRNGERAIGRSEKVNGPPVKKSERNQSEIVNGDRSEQVNGLSIKNKLKIEQSTTAKAAADSGFNLLTNVGFDEQTAKRLSERHGAEAIQRQINWLPFRRPTRSRLGLLRRAIEGNWLKPELAGVNKSGSSHPKYLAATQSATIPRGVASGRTEQRPTEARQEVSHRVQEQAAREAAISKFWCSLAPEERARLEAEAVAVSPKFHRGLIERGGVLGNVARQQILDEFAMQMVRNRS